MNPEQNNQNNGQLPAQNYQQPVPGPNPVPQMPVQNVQNTPNPGPGMPGHNPYEFIMNPAPPPKKPLALPGNSLMHRIAIVGGIVTTLIVLVVVVLSVLSGGSKEKNTDFLAIAQQQTELIRVATAGSTLVTALPAQNLAQNVQASVTSQNNELLAYLKSNGQKISVAQLAAKRSKTTDDALAAAKSNNTYDAAFTAEIQTELDAYMNSLQKAYKLNPGPKANTLLSSQYEAAKLLKTASN